MYNKKSIKKLSPKDQWPNTSILTIFLNEKFTKSVKLYDRINYHSSIENNTGRTFTKIL